MYFWNIKKLKAQLIERPLTERETLPYVIAVSLMYFFALEVLTYSYTAISSDPVPYSVWDYISAVFTVATTVLGTVWIFKKNKVSNENYFLQRFTALGWVVLIRVTAFLIFAIALIFIALLLPSIAGVFHWESYGSILESSTTFLVINVLFYLFYYWYFGKHIAEVAQKATYD
jgi:hypothetical protein